MRIFKLKFRVVQVTSGYIAQVLNRGSWTGVTAEMNTWISPDYQLKYCTNPTKEEAQNIINSYKAIIE